MRRTAAGPTQVSWIRELGDCAANKIYDLKRENGSRNRSAGDYREKMCGFLEAAIQSPGGAIGPIENLILKPSQQYVPLVSGKNLNAFGTLLSDETKMKTINQTLAKQLKQMHSEGDVFYDATEPPGDTEIIHEESRHVYPLWNDEKTGYVEIILPSPQSRISRKLISYAKAAHAIQLESLQTKTYTNLIVLYGVFENDTIIIARRKNALGWDWDVAAFGVYYYSIHSKSIHETAKTVRPRPFEKKRHPFVPLIVQRLLPPIMQPITTSSRLSKEARQVFNSILGNLYSDWYVGRVVSAFDKENRTTSSDFRLWDFLTGNTTLEYIDKNDDTSTAFACLFLKKDDKQYGLPVKWYGHLLQDPKFHAATQLIDKFFALANDEVKRNFHLHLDMWQLEFDGRKNL